MCHVMRWVWHLCLKRYKPLMCATQVVTSGMLQFWTASLHLNYKGQYTKICKNIHQAFYSWIWIFLSLNILLILQVWGMLFVGNSDFFVIGSRVYMCVLNTLTWASTQKITSKIFIHRNNFLYYNDLCTICIGIKSIKNVTKMEASFLHIWSIR